MAMAHLYESDGDLEGSARDNTTGRGRSIARDVLTVRKKMMILRLETEEAAGAQERKGRIGEVGRSENGLLTDHHDVLRLSSGIGAPLLEEFGVRKGEIYMWAQTAGSYGGRVL
jgi:hypothetical protein